jgi:hypothetical protein
MIYTITPIDVTFSTVVVGKTVNVVPIVRCRIVDLELQPQGGGFLGNRHGSHLSPPMNTLRSYQCAIYCSTILSGCHIIPTGEDIDLADSLRIRALNNSSIQSIIQSLPSDRRCQIGFTANARAGKVYATVGSWRAPQTGGRPVDDSWMTETQLTTIGNELLSEAARSNYHGSLIFRAYNKGSLRTRYTKMLKGTRGQTRMALD